VRLQEELVARIDRERKRARLTRAAAINEALDLWVGKRRYDQAVRRDKEGYENQPVRADELEPILGAQVWPR
jgi:hypothetical protein